MKSTAPLSLRRGFFLLLSGFLLSSTALSPALAVDVPDYVAPGQVEKRFDAPLAAPNSPDLKLPAPVDAEPSAEEIEKLSKQTFLLQKVEIDGATAYPSGAFEPLYAASVGKTISLLEAQSIAKQITNRYRNDGYVLSQAVVVPQDVTSGTLVIRVVEGVVGSVSLQGDVRGENERKIIEAFGEKMKALKPARVQDLERYLLLINDLSGVTVSGLLRPEASQFGAAELVLSLKNDDFDGSYTLDNRGSKFIGPWQHQFLLARNSSVGFYDRTQARFFFVNPGSDELLGGDLRYALPVGSEGTNLGLLFSHIHTNPRSSLQYLEIAGTSTQLELRADHPFIRQRKENLLGRAVLSYQDSETDVYRDTRFSRDKLRVFRLGGTYNLVDSARGNNLIDAEISQGLDILAATDKGDDRSNAKGDVSFTKFNLDVQRVQYLPSNFSFLVAATGQYSLDPLLVDEQFSLGGSEYGRAFDPATSLGDHGVGGKLEVRYTDPVSERYLETYQLYAFYDIGKAWLKEAASGANSKTLRSSTGAGVRMNFTENFSGNFEAAVPLVTPSDEQTEYRNIPRLFLSVTARF